jgi:hypothetical protein
VLKAAEERGVELQPLSLDLTDRASIEDAVETVVRESGGVFGLVNNGGIGLRGCVEDCSEHEIRGRVRSQRVRHDRPDAGRPATHAGGGLRPCGDRFFGRRSRLRLRRDDLLCEQVRAGGFGEGLAQELAPFGIQSVIVEPGMIKTTRWSLHRGTAQRAIDPASPYHDLFWESEAIADRIVERSRTRRRTSPTRSIRHSAQSGRECATWSGGAPPSRSACAAFAGGALRAPLLRRASAAGSSDALGLRPPSAVTAGQR